MDAKQFLIETIKTAFASHYTMREIEKNICQIAKDATLKKYKDHYFFENKIQYKLYNVEASLMHYSGDIQLKNVSIRLIYFCVSKLPKTKQERLRKIKRAYDERDYLEWTAHKIPLWVSFSYSIEIDLVLSNEINLSLPK